MNTASSSGLRSNSRQKTSISSWSRRPSADWSHFCQRSAGQLDETSTRACHRSVERGWSCEALQWQSGCDFRFSPLHYLEEAVGVLVAEVNVDHLQQHSDFIVAHLVIVVLVGPAQVSVNPGGRQLWSRKWQEYKQSVLLGPWVAINNNNITNKVTLWPGIWYQLFTSCSPPIGSNLQFMQWCGDVAAISLTPSDRCLFCPKRQTCGRSDKAPVFSKRQKLGIFVGGYKQRTK